MNLTKREREALKKTLTQASDEVGLFRGVFDAENGSLEFMNGILTVLEAFAYYTEDSEFIDAYVDNFLENMRKSLDKANKL